MPLAGSRELQLSKGIRRVFRGVLGAVPAVDNGCAEVIPESHRAVGLSLAAALTQSAITERGERTAHVKTRSSWRVTAESRRHLRWGMRGATFTLPEGIFHKGGAHSFLDDFGNPTLQETFNRLTQTDYIAYGPLCQVQSPPHAALRLECMRLQGCMLLWNVGWERKMNWWDIRCDFWYGAVVSVQAAKCL